VVVEDTMEVAGVNDRAQLAVAEAELRDRINEAVDAAGRHDVDPRPPTSTPRSPSPPTSCSCPA